MDKITFIGESLWQGNLGHILVVISFISAITAGWFYFRSANEDNDRLGKIARKVFYVQAFSVVAIFALLFYVIFTHRYEYYYAWRHSSNALPVYYMISCFWEGQEGSFLLWMFWNAFLGVILTRTAKEWESPVLAVVCLAQIALSTMLLGLKIGDITIGLSPFDLLREQTNPDILAGIPSMAGKAMYLKAVTDGRGLNLLLQNYWMVIHPPTLFFGFASALVPFAYSIAGLWKGKDRQWINPALIWSLVGVGILGGGIIMGGFWAYESLTFGGYWAWDPVENASLMPWLIMASGAHMLLISKNTGRHLFTSHLLIQLSFWLVLYATFLTRSGILGEASVHSFTDLKLSGQLLLFLFGFLMVSLCAALQNKRLRIYSAIAFFLWIALLIAAGTLLKGETLKSINSITHYINIVFFVAIVGGFIYVLFQRTKTEMEDEKWTSREFWMFIGSMFLILSLVQVFSATSIPVFNKLFNGDTAVPKADAYNRIQLWLAMPVMVLIGIGQWFRYKSTPGVQLRKSLLRNLIVAVVVALLLAWGFGIWEPKYLLFLFVGVFLVVGNVLYFGSQKGLPWLGYGAAVAHTGFGILLIGVLVSSVNQNVLTGSDKGIDLQPEVDEKGNIVTSSVKFNRENRILYLGEPVKLNGYEAMFTGVHKGVDKDSGSKYFHVLFVKRNADGSIQDSFTLLPKTISNPQMGVVNEPSTRHYLSRDVFTHINHESDMEREEPFSGFKMDTVHIGKTVLTGSGKNMLRLDSVESSKVQNYQLFKLTFMVKTLTDSVLLHPVWVINLDDVSEQAPIISDQSDLLGVNLRISRILVSGDKKIAFEIISAERKPKKKYVVLKAVLFPWINLVWAGTIIMVLGFAIAVINRIKQLRAMRSA